MFICAGKISTKRRGTKCCRPLSVASLQGNLGSLEIACWCYCKDWPAEDDAESSGKPQQDGHGTRLSLERLHGLPKYSRLFSLVLNTEAVFFCFKTWDEKRDKKSNLM